MSDGKLDLRDGFEGVPAEVWSFQVGGHQVCRKWLRDRRGRLLNESDLSAYRAIVDAISTRDYYALFGYLQSSSFQLADVSDPVRQKQVWDELAELKALISSNIALG